METTHPTTAIAIDTLLSLLWSGGFAVSTRFAATTEFSDCFTVKVYEVLRDKRVSA